MLLLLHRAFVMNAAAAAAAAAAMVVPDGLLNAAPGHLLQTGVHTQESNI
jgi:hypothetical protein